MDGGIFWTWLEEVFIPSTAGKCHPDRPVILLLDNFSSHLQSGMLTLAAANNIEILGFPAHSTDLLQPLDVGLMGPLKQHFRRAVKSWRMKDSGINMTADLTTSSMVDVLALPQDQKHASVWDETFKPSNIRSAFSKAGIWPMDPDAVKHKLFGLDETLPNSMPDDRAISPSESTTAAEDSG